jgi:hypothetical protein
MAADNYLRGRVKRADLLRRWGELKTERATWMAHWTELSQFLLPRNGRYFTQDRNRGNRRHNQIYDNTGTRASGILAAGLMANMTSPARPWFRLETPDDELNEHQPVKVWLAEVTELMLAIFAKSNTYASLHQQYQELGVFGTAGSVLQDDFETVIHHNTLTIGEYAVATNYRGLVDTLGREFEKTVSEIVREFGRDNCSTAVKNLYDRGALGTWVPIIHLIEPRADRDPSSKLASQMAWRDCYFEAGAHEDQYLREGGFKRFPALVSRWATAGGDVYGNSPGMEALGDVKQLQQEQLRKGQGIDYKTKPPLQAPTSMKNSEVEMMPGGISYYDGSTPGAGIRTAFDVNIDLSHLLEDIRDVRERIKSAFYADLWLALEQIDQGKMTAYEVAERKEEKLLLLGPTSERLHNEILNPLVERTFERIVKSGILPPPPEELHGMQLNVNFISMLAQAQRAIGTNNIDRFVGNLGQIATFKPAVLDNFDEDAWAERYSDMLGVDPELIVASDKVALMRKTRADQQAQAQQAAQANVAADTAQKLGNAQVTPDNALGILGQGAGRTLANGFTRPAGPTSGVAGYT